LASGSLNGADIKAPPGIVNIPNNAGITERRTLLDSKPLKASIVSVIKPVSFRIYPKRVMSATEENMSQVTGSVKVVTATSMNMAGGFSEERDTPHSGGDFGEPL